MKRVRHIQIGLLLLVLGLAAVGCKRPPTSVTQSREMMGTFASVTAVAADKATAQVAVEAGYARLADVNRLMSDYAADSEIGRLNQLSVGGTLVVSPETFCCLQKAIEVAEASGGAFDLTCRPIVSLWKQCGKQKRLPSISEVAAAHARVGWQQIELDPEAHRVTVLSSLVEIDLGGIAKGYALDLAADAMRESGATNGLVDVGGDILAFGTRPDGQPWRIGVRHPFEPGLAMKLELSDAAVATSGEQQRFYEIDGKRYSHIINPRSGSPVEQAPSVTVIAPDGLTADAWATAFSVLTPAEGRALLESRLKGSGIEVMWILGTSEQPQVEKTVGFDLYVVE